MPGFLRPALVLFALAATASRLPAQVAPVTAPKGYWRIDIAGGFFSADQRYRNGTRESLANDFARDTLGTTFWPQLATVDSLLRKITGVNPAALNLGQTTASQLITTGSMTLGLAYGLFSKLTLFANVPIVSRVVRSTYKLAADGTAGFNPADPTFGSPSGQAQTSLFFHEFDLAMASLQQRIDGGEFTDPEQLALAQQTVASGTLLRNDLFSLIQGTGTSSAFMPTASSDIGKAILSKVTSLQGTLNGLGVSFVSTPVLPVDALSDDDLNDFITNPAGPIAGSLKTPSITALGDVELGAGYTLIDQIGKLGARSGFRVAVQGLVRLRTSQLDSPGHFFDVGTGDRQPDVEGTVVGDGLIGHFGARAFGSYNLQLAGDANKRITHPDQPIGYASTLAAVSRTPGSVVTAGIAPFVRLAETFAFTAGVTWQKKGADKVTLFQSQAPIPGAPVEWLEEETDGSWTSATVGLIYSAPPSMKKGKVRMPVDAGAVYEGVLSSSGALRVPANYGVRFWLRIYFD